MSTVPEFRRFVSGMAFKNGKLYVFSTRDVMVLKSWPDMRAWRRTKNKPWYGFRPGVRLDNTHIDISTKEFRQRYGIDDDVPPLLGPPAAPPRLEQRDTRELRRLAKEWDLEPWLPSDETATMAPSAEPEWLVRQEREARLARPFFDAIPEDVRSLVSAFPGHHWHLLSMLARCPRAADLLISNPVLGYALSHSWVYTGRKSQYAHKWVRRHMAKPQRELCGLLGFPANESSVRILRKLEPRHCCTVCLLDLRRLMADGDMLDHLRHLPRVTPGVIKFLNLVKSTTWQVSRSLVMDWFRFLQREQVLERRHDTYHMMEDTLNMLPRELDPGWLIPYRSIAGMRRAHDAANRLQFGIAIPGHVGDEGEGLGASVDLSPWERYADQPLGPAPIAGTKDLIPLTTGRQILDEAASMRHCVATYLPKILEGKSYIYRLLKPERATLELVPCPEKRWKMSQISGLDNCPVKMLTRQLIDLWLKARQCREADLQPF